MKKRPIGKTGLTQKDAIFEIVKRLSGELYTTDLPMKPIINNLGTNFLFREIVESVLEGIENGTIPSKHNKPSSVAQRQTYAYQIVQYSLKHDRRLNGGKIGAREARKKQISRQITNKISSSALIKEMTKLSNQDGKSESDILLIHSYIAGEKFKIILEAFEIDLNALPTDLLIELKIIESEAA